MSCSGVGTGGPPEWVERFGEGPLSHPRSSWRRNRIAQNAPELVDRQRRDIRRGSCAEFRDGSLAIGFRSRKGAKRELANRLTDCPLPSTGLSGSKVRAACRGRGVNSEAAHVSAPGPIGRQSWAGRKAGTYAASEGSTGPSCGKVWTTGVFRNPSRITRLASAMRRGSCRSTRRNRSRRATSRCNARYSSDAAATRGDKCKSQRWATDLW